MKHNLITTVSFVIIFLLGFFLVYNPNNESNNNIIYTNMDEGEHLRFVFLGSSSCPFSNNDEIQEIVRHLNQELRGLSGIFGMKYISTGISTDISASLGVSYLEKTGNYDEIISGFGWYNSGMFNYLWNPDLGYASTPQILLFKSNFEILANDHAIFNISQEDSLINRYIGAEEIEQLYDLVLNSNIETISRDINLELQ